MKATDQKLRVIDAYGRAATYLPVGQMYRQENALLRERPRPELVKLRLLGHGGTDQVNLIVGDKLPPTPWPTTAARERGGRGASVWGWASNDEGGVEPDVVLACAGDVATLETMAAAKWLRERAPGLRVRVVNVVDLRSLLTPAAHPHGMTEERFVALFPRETDVVFAFHGYPGAVHRLVHGRPNAGRFHVRGYREEGATTAPFDRAVLNQVSRYHLAIEAIKRSRHPLEGAAELVADCEAELARHRASITEHVEDLPESRDWWSAPGDEEVAASGQG